MTPLQEYRTQITNYLRDGYGATNFAFEKGRNGHTKLKFALNDKQFSLVLNENNNAGYAQAVNLKLQDIRRTFGEPTYPTEATRKEHRTLDQMTATLKPRHHIIEDAPATNVAPLSAPAAVALYANGKALRFRLPNTIVDAFNLPGITEPGTEILFTAPGLWSIRHGTGPRLKKANQRYELTSGGLSTWEKLGTFSSTPATATLVNGRIEVRLAAALNKIKPEDTIEHAPSQDQAEPKSPATAVGLVYIAGVSEADIRETLRAIRRVETLTPYRLRKIKVDDAEQWRFTAPSIHIED